MKANAKTFPDVPRRPAGDQLELVHTALIEGLLNIAAHLGCIYRQVPQTREEIERRALKALKAVLDG